MKYTIFFLTMLAGSISFAGHLGYVYPAGGRAGETVEILVGGQNNWGCRDIFTGTGAIKCIKFDRTVNIPFLYTSQKKYYQQYLQAKSKGLPLPEKPEKQDDWRPSKMLDRIDELTPMEMDLLLRTLYTRPNPLQISPSINQKFILQLQIAKDAKPGIYYLRLWGPGYISNPVPFIVGTAPEIREPGFTPPYEKKQIPSFELPASVNGQIRPGETDIFHVRLKANQRCYFKFYGRFFKPYVGDGVPGFFQPILELQDKNGKQVAIAERNGVEIDPLMVCTVPEDGEYTLKVRDSLYRGREDFVYRIECGTGEPPREKIDFALPDLPRKTYLPGMTATEPVLVTGQLGSGMKLAIRIPGKKGETRVFQTFARKIGSSLDTVLRLYAPDGKLLAENDDTTPEVLVGNAMHFADSHLMFTFPADGDYLLEMRDRADEKGEFALRIDRPRPDFQLIVTPSGLETARANNFPVTLFIQRQEGFNNPIELNLSGGKKLRLSGCTSVLPGVSRMQFTVYEAWSRKDYAPEKLQLTGSAKLPDGTVITRTAIAADPAMQAFAYTHYIIAPELLHAAQWRYPASVLPAGFPREITVRPGTRYLLKFKVQSIPQTAKFETPRLDDAPAWLRAETPQFTELNKKSRIFLLTLPLVIAKDAPADGDVAQYIQLPLQYEVVNKDKQTRIRKSTLPLPVLRIKTERVTK